MKSGLQFLRPVLFIVLALLGAFLMFLVHAWVTDYRPASEVVILEEEPAPALADSARLNLLIWNIGYAGLDATMDFFYDGGKQVRPTEEGVRRNMEGIVETLGRFTGSDFILLQEVDLDSRRSYRTNQFEAIETLFPGYGTYFGMNYRVRFVPLPPKSPMGKVQSGLMTISAHVPVEVVRHQFPGNYAWPMKLFMLDRCFLVKRYPLSNGSELLVINTHNSAYDDGSLREQQMAYLKEFLVKEFALGNYIVVGGDWNQSPHGLAPELPGHRFDTINLTYVEKDYPAPDWKWAFDPTLPTNRRVTIPYDRDRSLTTIIDYYLLSPNIRLESVGTLDLDFRYSDHQPVQLQISLLPDNS